jgi:hypothetical protein
MIDTGSQVRGVGIVLHTVEDDRNSGRRNRFPTVGQLLSFTSRGGPKGVAHRRWPCDHDRNQRVIRVLYEPGKGDFRVEFIISPVTFHGFREGESPILLRTQDVIDEGSHRMFIKANFGLNAKLHQFHRGIMDRAESICGRKGRNGLMQQDQQQRENNVARYRPEIDASFHNGNITGNSPLLS